MIRKILITITLILSFFSVYCQNGTPTGAGARGLAMGDVGVTFQDINALYRNQAGLGFLEAFSASANAERRFMISSINSASVGIAYPMKMGTFGLDIQYFGAKDYNEQKIGIAYARKLFSKLSIGAQIDYINFRIPEYGSSGILTFEAGVMAQLFPKFFVGTHIYSPLQVSVNENEKIPTVLSFGASYVPSEKVSINLEVEKDIDFKPNFKGGVEYQIIKALSLRFGVGTNPTLFSFGTGVALSKKLRLDIAASYHQILGFTPGISVVWH